MLGGHFENVGQRNSFISSNVISVLAHRQSWLACVKNLVLDRLLVSTLLDVCRFFHGLAELAILHAIYEMSYDN